MECHVQGFEQLKLPVKLNHFRSSYLLERQHCWNRKRFGATTIGSTSIQRRIVDASYICTGKAWHVPNHLFGATTTGSTSIKHVHSLEHTFHDWTCLDMVFWTSPDFVYSINSASMDWQCIQKWTSCFFESFPSPTQPFRRQLLSIFGCVGTSGGSVATWAEKLRAANEALLHREIYSCFNIRQLR